MGRGRMDGGEWVDERVMTHFLFSSSSALSGFSVFQQFPVSLCARLCVQLCVSAAVKCSCSSDGYAQTLMLAALCV